MITLRSGHRIAVALATLLAPLLSSCGTVGLGKGKRLEVVKKGEMHTQSRFEAKGTLSFARHKATKFEPAYVEAAAQVDGEAQEQFMIWPESAVPHQNLDPSKAYLLEFHEDTFIHEKGEPRVVRTLFRVRDPESKRILADSSVCPLHDEPMELEEESGVYGGDYPDSYFLRSGARKRRFPNDAKVYLVCGSGIRHLTWACPECVRLSNEWARRHGISD